MDKKHRNEFLNEINDLNKEELYVFMLKHIIKFNSDNVLSQCYMMDFDLLQLEHSIEKGSNFVAKYQLFPNYNLYLATLCFLAKPNKSKRPINNNDIEKINECLSKMLRINIKEKPKIILNEIANSQVDWQKKYYFRTYLIYLFFSQENIKEKMKNITDLTPLKISSFCLLIKFFSDYIKYIEETSKRKLYYKSIRYFIDIITIFLEKHIKNTIIDLKTFQDNQIKYIENSNYDLFAAKMLIQKYPIINDNGKHYLTSLMYIQNGILSSTIDMLKAKSSKLVGDAFENIVYDFLYYNYKYRGKNSLNDKCIQKNPKSKADELCDVLVKKGNEYLLIDCKARDILEDVYAKSNENYQLDNLLKSYAQRYKKIKQIKKGNFSTYFPNDVNVDNIYSLIVVLDDSCYSKEVVINELSKNNNLDDIAKKYCFEHIDLITFDDLLKYVAYGRLLKNPIVLYESIKGHTALFFYSN